MQPLFGCMQVMDWLALNLHSSLCRLQVPGGHLMLVTALCSSASVFTRSASRARLSRILRGQGAAGVTAFAR